MMTTTFSSTSEGTIERDAAYAETGVVTHNGQEFASGGAYVSDEYLMAYLHGADPIRGISGDGRRQYLDPTSRRMHTWQVRTWDGTPIGNAVATHDWSTPYSHVSTHMYQVRVWLADGRLYIGRSTGGGMIVRAKRAAEQKVK